MPTHHALISPSMYDRAALCPGSVLAGKDVPRTSSIYADKGSAIHKLGDTKLKNSAVDLRCFLGTDYRPDDDKLVEPLADAGANAVSIDQDMIDMANEYAERVFALRDQVQGTLYAEGRVYFDDLIKDGSGTADAIIVSEVHRKILVVDLKTGRGHRVDAYDNSQLKLYALGALRTMDMLYDNFRSLIDNAELHIIQPPLDNYDTWSIDVKELEKFGQEAKAVAELALSNDAPFVAGEVQCQWCPIKATCTTRAAWAMESVGQTFDVFPEAVQQIKDGVATSFVADELNAENLAVIVERIPFIRQWCDDMEARAKEVAREDNGRGLKGFKFVAGRKSRAWTNESHAVQHLLGTGLTEAEIYERSFVSPAKAEKLVAKEHKKSLENLITTSLSAPVLVRESDKREAVTFEDGSEFAA